MKKIVLLLSSPIKLAKLPSMRVQDGISTSSVPVSRFAVIQGCSKRNFLAIAINWMRSAFLRRARYCDRTGDGLVDGYARLKRQDRRSYSASISSWAQVRTLNC
ncbi:MAG: hypothetical protein CMN05_12220 [Roseibacillus sp.]|jgi:hypothetical protein|nr:hypothetical protein [Roseibacillus sp.]